jgi:hypothetical protein
MAPLDPVQTVRVLEQIQAGTDGGLLETLIAEVFCAIPGVSLADQDRLSARGNEELDLAFRNVGEPGGLVQFGPDVLVECKSQGAPVDAQAVNWFATKLRRRQQPLGVLVALSGITGKGDTQLRAAQAEIDLSATEGQQILVVIGRELAELQSGEHFANLLALKRSRLISGRQMVIATTADMESLSPVPASPESARLLLHPAANLAGQGAEAWQLALDAGRLQLRRHRREALALIDQHRPVLDPALTPGGDSVGVGAKLIREKLDEVHALVEEQERALLNHESLDNGVRVEQALVLAAAACVDLLRLDASALGAPDPTIVAINVETFAPSRVAVHLGSALWTLLTRYYLGQLSGEQRTEQLREVAMYALLSILIDQVLLMGLV